MKQELPRELSREIARLLTVKRNSDEAERRLQNPTVQEYIARELERQKAIADQMPDDRNYDWRELNRIFFNLLQEEKREIVCTGWNMTTETSEPW